MTNINGLNFIIETLLVTAFNGIVTTNSSAETKEEPFSVLIKPVSPPAKGLLISSQIMKVAFESPLSKIAPSTSATSISFEANGSSIPKPIFV